MQPQNNPNRFTAIELRKSGHAIGYISERLKVPKGTVYHWVRDVELTPEQKASLLCNRRLGGSNGREKAVVANKKKYGDLRNAARKVDFNEADGNPLHVAGCMLYWAEGTKAINQASFCNTDPIMLRKFFDFLKYLGVDEEKIKISCQVHSTSLN